MKKIIIILFLMLIMLLPCYSTDKPIITVLDFTTNNISKSDMQSIISLLSSALFRSNSFTVIDVNQRTNILNEVKFSNSGCSDESCQLEIGKILSAQMIVIGDIAKVGSRYILTTKMIATETGKTLQTYDGIYKDMDSLIDNVFVIAETLAGTHSIKIGDHYAGGIVFYLNGNGGGLACAEIDQGTNIQWSGRYGIEVGNTSKAIGKGAANTSAIVAAHGDWEPDSGLTDYAANLCEDLELYGYDDWFLPSVDELDLMYENLHAQGLGGFVSDYYWSSSQTVLTGAWCQYFGSGIHVHCSKLEGKHVRAVRAF